MVVAQSLPYLFLAGFALLTLSFFMYRACLRLCPALANLIRGLQIVLALALMIVHGMAIIGRWNTLWLFFTSLLAGSAAEYVGIKFGWLFGSYCYSDRVGPKILGVPISISLLWCVVVYLAFWQSCIIASFVGQATTDLHVPALLLLPIFVILIDLVADPIAADEGLWTWRKKGGYAGIPLSNFIGWFITSGFIAVVLSLFWEGTIARTPESRYMIHLPAFGYVVFLAASTRVALERKLKWPAIIGSVTIVVLTAANVCSLCFCFCKF
jgi:uncharacterized membrane protein